MLTQAGLPLHFLPWIGASEILAAFIILGAWNVRAVFAVNAFLMILATVAVAVRSPSYLTAAFNPATLNLLMIALSIIGWLASRNLPSASRCLREDPRRRD